MQGQAARHLDPHHVLEDTSATPPGRQNDETPVSMADRGLAVSSRRAAISPPRVRGLIRQITTMPQRRYARG